MAIDPRKKAAEIAAREAAKLAGGLIKKVTKAPKTPKGKPSGKTTKTQTVTGSTAPSRTPKAQPPVTPSTKPSPKVSQQPSITRKDVKAGKFKESEYLADREIRAARAATNKRIAAREAAERAAARKAESAQRAAKASKKPSATPAKQSTKKKPTADLEPPKTKKTPAKKTPAKKVEPTPIGGPSPYLDDVVGDEFALARAAQAATDDAARLADDALPGIRTFGGVVDDAAPAATEAIETGIETAAKRGLRDRAKAIGAGANLGRPFALGSALQIPTLVLDENSPGWMKNTADLAAIAGGALALRGFKGSNLLGKIFRGGAGLTGAAAIPSLIGSGQQVEALPPATELPTEQVITPGDVFPGEVPPVGGGMSPEEEYLQGVQGVIDSIQIAADDEAAIGSAQVESSADAALQQLIDLYGGMANVQAGVAANDPVLAQELAAIEADYNAGMSQIANNYNAAIATVQQYQEQVNSAYGLLSGQLRQSTQAAAGGLEMGGIPTGLIGGEAAMSGISDTALGGAGITGAALTRALGEAGQAGITADQMGAQIDLGTALAQGTISQADLQAALGRDRLGALTGSRRAAAERASEERIRQQELAREGALTAATLRYERELAKEEKAAEDAQRRADRKSAAAQYEAEAKLSLAQMVAKMTPEEYARWKGSSAGKSNYKTPSWFGKRLAGASDKVITGLDLAETPNTIGSVNSVLDKVFATLSQETARNPLTAFAAWEKFYAELSADGKKILRSRNVPDSAGAMYRELFKSTPSK